MHICPMRKIEEFLVLLITEIITETILVMEHKAKETKNRFRRLSDVLNKKKKKKRLNIECVALAALFATK